MADWAIPVIRRLLVLTYLLVGVFRQEPNPALRRLFPAPVGERVPLPGGDYSPHRRLGAQQGSLQDAGSKFQPASIPLNSKS